MDSQSKMAESDIMRLISIRASEKGARLWRNNVGLFYSNTGEPTRCGLCKGSSDLIGIAADGRMLAVEVKTTSGHRRIEQVAFVDMINKLGGIAFFATSPEDFARQYEDRLCKNQ